MSLQHTDSAMWDVLNAENKRQTENLELIASENYVSPSVMEAVGSVLTNKYAEGYPGKRYYGGCEVVDIAENIARDRLKELYNADYVNVQPHSGSQANMAVFMSFINPGDTFMGLNLAHGGHLTHGSPVNFSGKLYHAVGYNLSQETGLLDYNIIEETAKREKPKLIIAGGSAYSRDWDYKAFRAIADSVGAVLMTDMAHPAGLIATGKLNDPLEYCHVVTSTTHKTLRGPRGGIILMRNDYENTMGVTTPKGDRLKMMSEILDSTVMPGIQGGPLMHVIMAKGVAFGEALLPSFSAYTEQIIKNARALASELTNYGFNIISGGTDNHLMLIDLSNKNITGKQAENSLEHAGITVNKNMVPYDKRSPFVTSGIRIGTPAITTRGMKEDDMKAVAGFISRAINGWQDEQALIAVKADVNAHCSQFPLFAYSQVN